MVSIFSQKHLSPRQSRWILFLNQFQMKIEHIPGNTNVIADLLSRIPEYAKGSLDEAQDVDIPEQSFEQPGDPLLRVAPITVRRGKVLLEQPAIQRRTKTSKDLPGKASPENQQKVTKEK